MWKAVRLLGEEQNDWKAHRWHKINTNLLRQETNRQLDALKHLPEESFLWDVYHGLQDSILTIQVLEGDLFPCVVYAYTCTCVPDTCWRERERESE